jgi:hypothetical protein
MLRIHVYAHLASRAIVPPQRYFLVRKKANASITDKTITVKNINT